MQHTLASHDFDIGVETRLLGLIERQINSD
jgi:hypothetical protein